MDTLFWTQFNPEIVVAPTTKKFFNQYLYKLVLHAPGGRSILTKDVEKDIENRKVWDRDINQFGWWGRNSKELENADVEFLETVKSIKNSIVNIKIRVEEPSIQIYAESNLDLQNIVKHNETKFKQYAKSVFGPENEDSEAILNSGCIIRHTEIKYKYKITIRDGRYSQDIKQSILSYLNNMDADQLQITASAKRVLGTASHSFVWGCYFYTNDLGIVTFLRLIAPNLISNIHELVLAPAK
jgi:hypothetical protein